MFKELLPVLRDRAVLLTVTLVDTDQIRVNIVPKKIKDGDNDALTTPLSVTGTAEELDAELSTTIVSFVGSHLQMKNTLEKAKAEMDAASKAAQTEARAKSKTATKSVPAKTEVTQNAPSAKPTEPAKPAPQKPASLFDMPTPATTPTAAPAESDEDLGFAEIDDDEPIEEVEELDDAA
jgi:PRTRC genetic system protein E